MAAQEGSTLVNAWAYPFAPKGNATSILPTDYLAGLASAEDGFFPLGQNGLWHGGIHFDRNTAANFDQDGGVRCIADGEIVAYRLNAKLESQAYPNGNRAGYSSGFTLVRHRLALPPLPPSTPASGNTPAAPPVAPPAEDILVFFSLYMHLLPWEGYAAGGASTPHAPKIIPDYYGVSTQYTVGAHSTDLQKGDQAHPAASAPGIRVRKQPSGTAEIIGWLPQETCITAGERHGKWGKISSFINGAPLNYHAGHPAEEAAKTGWVFLDEMEPHDSTPSLDAVLKPTVHASVTAGTLLGYVGEYQRASEAINHGNLPPKLGERPVIHVEIFSGQDIAAFIQRSKARVQQLPDLPRTFLLVEQGAQFAQPIAPNGPPLSAQDVIKETADSPSLGEWCKVQKTDNGAAPAGAPFWVKRSEVDAHQTRDTWSDFPLSTQSLSGPAVGFDRVISTSNTGLIQVGTHKWFDVYAADANDTVFQGWVCDTGHPHVSVKSPWDWPGFDVHSLATPISQMFQRGLHIADSGSPDEQVPFETAFDSARSDTAIKALEDAIDSQETRDGKITAEELRRALRKPWLAERIDHMIFQYESEWGGPMSKWDALDALMNAGLAYWRAEKARIATLQIWPPVTALSVDGFPASANVYHIHPVGIISNFINPDSCACGCCLENKVRGSRFKLDLQTTWYGPLYSGVIALGNCPALTTMLQNGSLSAIENRILRAMSANEGNIDAVQSIDKAIISAGAMQKTIRGAESKGELATQIAAFRDAHPAEYQQVFANCGWTVVGSGTSASLGYSHPTFTNGQRLIGETLKTALRRDYSLATFGSFVKSPPVAAMAHGVSHPLYQERQVKDFIDRLNHAIDKVPAQYSHAIKEYFHSAIGRATVLDQDVNAPSNTAADFKKSLDRFFAAHPTVSRDPSEWGTNRYTYETQILQDYGTTREMAILNGVSVAPERYNSLVQKLGAPSE